MKKASQLTSALVDEMAIVALLAYIREHSNDGYLEAHDEFVLFARKCQYDHTLWNAPKVASDSPVMTFLKEKFCAQLRACFEHSD